jgi:asparagine synthase (glutamine-hydrolysing)
MCGIAGAVGYDDPARATDVVRRMVAALERRGPDSGGLDPFGRAVLGHRRLAIFDLSAAGHQPMASDDGAISVVFNGAIYNFHELRGELEGRGCRFRSDTDTEVLVHGYRVWGIDALVSRLRGMFAFGLWDEPARRLYLVRDRLGVKPLAYVERNGALTFASTVRALRRGGLVHEIDPEAVAEYLEFGFVTDARTVYAGAVKVPAASIVEWHDGVVRTREYWTPPAAGTAPRLSFDDAVDRTEELLLQAVRARLQADVPVCALLSGGIDSGLVCWAVAKLGASVTAFTVGTPGHAADESADAIQTAREIGIDHRLLELSDGDPVDIEELVTAYAEPFASESAFGMLRVSEAIAQSSKKVVLTGDGGDDVFLGYPQHRHLLFTQRLARLTPGVAAPAWRAVRGLVPRVGVLRRGVHAIDFTVGGLSPFLDARNGLPAYEAKGFLGERLAGVTVAQRNGPWSIRSARNVLSEYLEHDRRTQFVAEYLTKVDGATMHYALEARSPFFDQELWEFASSLPHETRLHGGRLKAVLRELTRRRVSERAATQRKRGFALPVHAWVAGRWRQRVRDSLRESLLAQQGWIRPEPVLRELASDPRGGHMPHQLWRLFLLEEWMRADAAFDRGRSMPYPTPGALRERAS